MSRNLLAAAGLALALPFSATAAERNMSYNFVDVGYADLNFSGQPFAVSDEELSVDGLSYQFAYELSDFVFLTSTYDEFSGDRNVSLRRRSFGAGLAFGLGDWTDVYLTASHVRVGLTHAELEDNGLDAEFGIRRMVASRSELFASAGYSSIFEENATRFSVGGRYWFTDGVALSLAYRDSGDPGLAGSGLMFSGRINF